MNTNQERAQKLAEEVLEMVSTILMEEIGGILRPEEELAPIVPLIEKHIHAAQRGAMQEIFAIANGYFGEETGHLRPYRVEIGDHSEVAG